MKTMISTRLAGSAAAILMLVGGAACQQNPAAPAATTNQAPAAPAPAPTAAPAPAAAPTAAPAPGGAGAKPVDGGGLGGQQPAAPAPSAAPAPAPGGTADNLDRRIRIVNNSGQRITLIQGSSTTQSDWGRDRIPTGTLPAGNEVVVDFNDNNGQCNYDLQATFQDGTTRQQRAVNICQVSDWVITSTGGQTR